MFQPKITIDNIAQLAAAAVPEIAPSADDPACGLAYPALNHMVRQVIHEPSPETKTRFFRFIEAMAASSDKEVRALVADIIDGLLAAPAEQWLPFLGSHTRELYRQRLKA